MSGRTGFVTAGVLAAALVLGAGRVCRAQDVEGQSGLRSIKPAADVAKKPILSAVDKAEAAILQAMKKPVDMEFIRTPLSDIVDFLGDKLGLPIFIDQPALEDEGISTSAPVTFHESGISARSALRLILRQLDLAWTIRGEMLVITTPEKAESLMQTKVYDVADLLLYDDRDDEPDYDSLVDLITSTIWPATWDEVGGPGSIRPAEADGIRALAVSQTREVHEELAALLAELRRVRDEKKGEKPKQPSPEEAIDRALARPINFEFIETPLSDVATFLREKLKIPIQIDERALADVGIETKQPLSARMSDVSVRTALKLMLGQLKLTWTVRDEVLLITTPEETESQSTTEVYNVADLVVTHDEYGTAHVDYDALIDLIASTIQPTTWDEVGGPGSVTFLEAPSLDVLIVSQTRDVHQRIHKLLADLRAVRRLPPDAKRGTKRRRKVYSVDCIHPGME